MNNRAKRPNGRKKFLRGGGYLAINRKDDPMYLIRRYGKIPA